ncbi:hypothetical protein HDU67_001551 [Dinochytrium kinnereticum]|nr:hypothetical protein HDU67_001551 [Dinochytrium kinnereticum]
MSPTVGVMPMDVVEITIPSPQDVTLIEALRVVNALQFGKVGDGIPVSVICNEVALARQFGNMVDVQAAKRQRDFGDTGDQLGRIAIDWPPALGAMTVYPRAATEKDPLGPSIVLPSSPALPRTSDKTPPLPGTSAIRSTPRNSGPPPKSSDTSAAMDVDQPSAPGSSSVSGEKEGKKKKNRKEKGKGDGSSLPVLSIDKASGTAPLPLPVHASAPVASSSSSPPPPSSPGPQVPLPPSQKAPSSQHGPDYSVRRGVHMSTDELMGVINKLFAEPISASITWAQFFAFSPRAIRMFTDRLKAKRVPTDMGEETLVESNFLHAPADTSTDMFDELLSILLDQVDLDDLTSTRVGKPPAVQNKKKLNRHKKNKKAASAAEGVDSSLLGVNSLAFKVSVDNILDSFSTEVDDEIPDEHPDEQREARCKVVAASPTLSPVTIGFGPGAVTLHKVTLDPGSQVLPDRKDCICTLVRQAMFSGRKRKEGVLQNSGGLPQTSTTLLKEVPKGTISQGLRAKL